jgi:hypothetical protein
LRTTPLFEALDAGGFVYNVRQSDSGTPYAGFRWQAKPAEPLQAFTALLEHEALRLTLYEPLGTDVQCDALNSLIQQQHLPLARMYQDDAGSGKLELTLGISLENSALDSSSLHALLLHLAACAADLRGMPTGASRQPPAMAPARDSMQLTTALQDLGFHARQDGGAFVTEQELPETGVTGQFSIYHLAAGWVRVAAQLQDNDTLSIDHLDSTLLNRLQLWAPVGRFVMMDAGGRPQLGCEVATPWLGRGTAEIIELSIRAAMRLLGTALRNHPNPVDSE